MREILFRAKNREWNEWVEGDLIHEPFGECIQFIKNECRSKIKVNPETVCQYTGLTDKNGRKIFEGDIITYQHDNDDCPLPNKDTKRRVGRVYFEKFRSCFVVKEGKNGLDIISQELFIYVRTGNRVEVIGNFFDNPKLLESCETEGSEKKC